MPEYKIIMPSKPRIVLEEGNKGVFEIDGLYPGYGHTLGNSLRRIILSSLPGASVTSIKIEGVSHEFQTMDWIKKNIIEISRYGSKDGIDSDSAHVNFIFLEKFFGDEAKPFFNSHFNIQVDLAGDFHNVELGIEDFYLPAGLDVTREHLFRTFNRKSDSLRLIGEHFETSLF